MKESLRMWFLMEHPHILDLCPEEESKNMSEFITIKALSPKAEVAASTNHVKSISSEFCK